MPVLNKSMKDNQCLVWRLPIIGGGAKKSCVLVVDVGGGAARNANGVKGVRGSPNIVSILDLFWLFCFWGWVGGGGCFVVETSGGCCSCGRSSEEGFFVELRRVKSLKPRLIFGNYEEGTN